MTLDYFHGTEAEQFSFFRIPKVLFTDPKYKKLSFESKALYGILLDRMSLSVKNGWLDKENRVYIIYTIDEITETLGCGEQKARKLLTELETNAGLIERKRQGLGKPNLIYVKNFITATESTIKSIKSTPSTPAKIATQNHLKSTGNNTDNNKTDNNYTDSLLIASLQENHGRNRIESNEREKVKDEIKENIAYDILLNDHPENKETLDEILELMVDVVSSNKPTMRISGDEKPISVVKNQFLSLTDEHIRFVMDSLSKNTTNIRNIRQYLLATLYNAPMTIGSYYKSLYNHNNPTPPSWGSGY